MALVKTLLKRVRFEAGRRGLNMSLQSSLADQSAFFAATRPVATEHELVRVGGAGDGGYLLPDDLEGISACFSPGVESIVCFEEDMIARGIRCYQADASIEDTPLKHPMVEFERKFLGIAADDRTMTLDEWVEAKMPGKSGDLLLQMDIEGSEWLVLAQTSDATLARFRIICVEFHDMDRIFDKFGFGVINQVFAKLLRQFDIVHVHPNNYSQMFGGRGYAIPSVLEYTFLRKDRVKARKPVDRLPHPLDEDNTKNLPPMHLPSEMYRSPGSPAYPSI